MAKKEETETEKTPDPEEIKETHEESHPAEPADGARQPFFKRSLHWVLSHKKFSIPLAAVVVLGVLAAIPFTRYAVAGMFLQQSFSLKVVDVDTNKPVTSATVRLAGKQTTTDNKGQATIRTNVGEAKLEVSKKYYQTTSREVLVPFKKSTKLTEVKLRATGRTVPVKVVNKVSGVAARNVTIKAEGSEVKTDSEGEAILVVPADKKELKASINGEGFNNVEVTLQVTSDEVPANTFELTPSGKIYFLSNQSGKIDVVKTNLDGTDRTVVVAGTGKEDKNNTVIFTSDDRKYIALISKRDGGDDPKLFLLDTGNDQLTTMDEGNAIFEPYGWSSHYFVYKVTRNEKKEWEEKRVALKSYDAKNKKIILLDEVGGEGNQYGYLQYQIGETALVGNEVVYSRSIHAYPGQKAQDKEASLNTVKPDGSSKRKLNTSTDKHAFQTYGCCVSISYGLRLYKPGELYFVNHRDQNKLYEYEDGQVREIPGKTASDLHDDSVNNYTYMLSPDGKRLAWAEGRDGKSVLFVGNTEGEDEKQIAAFDEHGLIGWYSNDYLLLDKEGSELYIIPASGLDSKRSPLKISDYRRSSYYYW